MSSTRSITLTWLALIAAARRDIEARGGIVLETLPGPDLGSVRFVLSDDPVRAWDARIGGSFRAATREPRSGGFGHFEGEDDPVDPRD